MEILDGSAGRRQDDGGPRRKRKSKEQANWADLFFGWNRVDKGY